MTVSTGLKAVAAVYLIGLHLVGLSYLIDKYTTRQSINDATEWRESLYQYYLRRDAALPTNKIVFLGDSHTHGLCVSCVTSDAVNFGIPGGRSDELLRYIPNYQSLKTAKAIFVQIGHNDLKRHSDEQIVNNLAAIINALPREPGLIFTSQFPVDEARRPDIAGFNERKSVLNQELKSLCVDRCTVVTLWPSDHGTDKTFSNTMLAADGVHLTKSGYRYWVSKLKEQLDVNS